MYGYLNLCDMKAVALNALSSGGMKVVNDKMYVISRTQLESGAAKPRHPFQAYQYIACFYSARTSRSFLSFLIVT